MCTCGLDYPCIGKCSCGCGHDAGSLIAWNLGYAKGRKDASEDISNMRDVDELCMEEIESDPLLNETYILIRRVDAQATALGSSNIKEKASNE